MTKIIALVLKVIAVAAAAEVAKQNAKQAKFKRQQAAKVKVLDEESDRLAKRQLALLAERGIANAASIIGSNDVNESIRNAAVLSNRLADFRK